jgi:hypothetical protein
VQAKCKYAGTGVGAKAQGGCGNSRRKHYDEIECRSDSSLYAQRSSHCLASRNFNAKTKNRGIFSAPG